MSNSMKDLALPLGSLILVTGTSGHIASHIANEALKFGYRVRGTVRSQEKADEISKVFNSPNYSTAIVKDMAHDGTFDEAVKGVDGIIHTASIVTFDHDPHKVIPDTIAGATGILKAALKEPSVKRFVYTSSSSAATLPKPNLKFHIDKNMWNDDSVKAAWAPPPYEESRAFDVYAASKTEAERAVWEFVKNEKPQFVVNAVLPNTNFGKTIYSRGATGGMIIDTYHGKPPVDFLPPQYMIDVIDDARIHLAALIDNTVANERIFAFAFPFNWNDVLQACRKARPNAKIIDDLPDQARDLSTVDNEPGAELLRKWYGQTKGYKTLEDSTVENLEGIE